MAQEQDNISTMHQLPEAGNITLNDLIYLVQGAGSDRDKKATLGAIFEALGDRVRTSYNDNNPSFLLEKLETPQPPESPRQPLGNIVFHEELDQYYPGQNKKILVANIKPFGITTEQLGYAIVGNHNFVDNSISGDRLQEGSIRHNRLQDKSVWNNNLYLTTMNISELPTGGSGAYYSIVDMVGFIGKPIIIYNDLEVEKGILFKSGGSGGSSFQYMVYIKAAQSGIFIYANNHWSPLNFDSRLT